MQHHVKPSIVIFNENLNLVILDARYPIFEQDFKRNNNVMKKLPNQQKGASAIFTIILLAVLGYAVYIGIQYVPQAVESKSIDS